MPQARTVWIPINYHIGYRPALFIVPNPRSPILYGHLAYHLPQLITLPYRAHHLPKLHHALQGLVQIIHQRLDP
ncbi:hypothetical protein [Commensalibacter communis]|uniref:hypothetical protein n=1 Tax=Commensalibacter communis TaxID=2972786 RepID=UPI00232B9FF2|nr:hypothetical protein [Commensalibacter communis]